MPEGVGNRVNGTEHVLDPDDEVRRRLVELYSPDIRALSSISQTLT